MASEGRVENGDWASRTVSCGARELHDWVGPVRFAGYIKFMKPVVVIGGGPAGSVFGAILANEGIPVVLFERGSHPRHHVGESLQPATIDILDEHLGIREAIAAEDFALKYGAVYVWGETDEPWSILFDERLERDVDSITEADLLAGDYERAWQVRRSRFDEIVFTAAKARGVEAHTDCGVAKVLFEGDRAVGVLLEDGRRVEASMVVDASGQRCMIGRHLGLIEPAEDLKSIAIYSYFRGAGGLPAPLCRHAQLITAIPEGWLWFIPISADVTSIGLVTQDRHQYTEDEFRALLERSPVPIDDGEYCEVDGVRGLQVVRDWSYSAETYHGPGHVLVGDAACFVDPILAGGVDFAIRGAANAAVAVMEALTGNGSALTRYSKTMRKDYQAWLRMARYWYGNNRKVDGFFWEAHQLIQSKSVSTPLRAFVYLTSGHYAADAHFKVFQEWQEKKMFEALGVNRTALKSALDHRRSDAPIPTK